MAIDSRRIVDGILDGIHDPARLDDSVAYARWFCEFVTDPKHKARNATGPLIPEAEVVKLATEIQPKAPPPSAPERHRATDREGARVVHIEKFGCGRQARLSISRAALEC